MSAEIRKKLAINYGLMLGGISIVINAIQYATIDGYNLAVQNSGNIAFTVLGFAVLIIVPLLGVLKAKKAQAGFITFGEAFKFVFTTVIYSAVLGVVWILLYTLVLEPDYQELAQEVAIEQMYEQNPDMGEAQMEQAVKFMSWFTTPWFLAVVTILFSALMGAVVAVIEAAIVQKKNPEFQP